MINIRKLELSDAEQYVVLHNLVWKSAYNHIFPKEVFEDRDKRTKEKIENFHNLVNAPNEIGYVAEVNNKIVGFMNATILSNYEHFKDLGYAELMGLYIHPDYQNKGIGSSFKQIFVDWAKAQGATKFVIGVLHDNFNARKVYEKWGGKLDSYTQPFVKLGVEYKEVFYTFKI